MQSAARERPGPDVVGDGDSSGRGERPVATGLTSDQPVGEPVPAFSPKGGGGASQLCDAANSSHAAVRC